MKKFIILIPLFNDWKSVSKLLNEIDLEVKNWDVDDFIVFRYLNKVLGPQEGLENDPEVRGVILTKFGPKRSHLGPAQADFYCFWVPDLRTSLPMSA